MHTAEGQGSSHLEEGARETSGGAGKILLLDLSAGYMGVLSLWKFIKLYTLTICTIFMYVLLESKVYL